MQASSISGANHVSPTQSVPASGDRRKANPDLPPRYEALRPFFDRRTQWGNSSRNSVRSSGQEVLAYRTLKDHFPELSPQEIFLTIASAKKLFGANPESP
jgi:hypothetical protein